MTDDPRLENPFSVTVTYLVDISDYEKEYPDCPEADAIGVVTRYHPEHYAILSASVRGADEKELRFMPHIGRDA